jgi:hypothetical protein
VLGYKVCSTKTNDKLRLKGAVSMDNQVCYFAIRKIATGDFYQGTREVSYDEDFSPVDDSFWPLESRPPKLYKSMRAARIAVTYHVDWYDTRTRWNRDDVEIVEVHVSV